MRASTASNGRAGKKQHGQERHWGSHVTDHDCPLPAAPAPSGRRAPAPRSLSSVPVGLTAVMQGCSELYRDGLPLMLQHGTQPSLPPPHRRGGPCAINIHVNS